MYVFSPFLLIIQYSISATSQMSFVKSLLCEAILNTNFFMWMSSKFDYVGRVRVSSFSGEKEMCWSVFTSAVNIYSIFLLSRIPPKILLA